MRPAPFALLACAVLALGGAVGAQPQSQGPRAVLFDQPNFQGRSVVIAQGSADLEAQDFAAMAMSGHFDGDWSLCTRQAFRGRCESVTGDVTDLAQLGLSRRVTSLRHNGDWSPPSAPASDNADGYYDRPASGPEVGAGGAVAGQGVAGQGVAGHGVVFFYRPQRGGADIPGQSRELADAFCRDQGYGPAVYYDTGGGILRDVLCRRD